MKIIRFFFKVFMSFIFISFFLFICLILIPLDQTSNKIEKPELTSKPKINKTISDKVYIKLKAFEYLIDYNVALTKIEEVEKNYKTIKIEKKDNLKSSWVRWEQTIEFSDGSIIKIQRNVDSLFVKCSQ